jgi:ATP-dependent Clp protease adaptor protein ClpS
MTIPSIHSPAIHSPARPWAGPSTLASRRPIGAAVVDAPDRVSQIVQKRYPNFKIVVLNDDHNTFEHVSTCLLKYIPGMNGETAWTLTVQIDRDGQAIVWVGPQEQAELYHMQLGMEGLTMGPLEAE